jgi:hypothetical protein
MRNLLRAVLCSLLLAGVVQAATFTDLITFGDSLCDVGNVAGITTPGIAPLVSGCYQETNFSDNVIWNERLAAYWGLPARTPGRDTWGPMPAALSGSTWAWGGSESSANSASPSWVTYPTPPACSRKRRRISPMSRPTPRRFIPSGPVPTTC